MISIYIDLSYDLGIEDHDAFYSYHEHLLGAIQEQLPKGNARFFLFSERSIIITI